jgi:hypothetical protein
MILAPPERSASAAAFDLQTNNTATVAVTSASKSGPSFGRRLDPVRARTFTILLSFATVLFAVSVSASSMAVRFKEGSLHGFLVLSNLDGKVIAEGDLTQVLQGDHITAHLTYQFKDGSRQEETTVFSQRGTFRLISYQLVQKGPVFKHPTEVTVHAASGEVTVLYTDDDGKEKTFDERMKLPPDLANGLVVILLKNLSPNAVPIEVPMVVATPKPRLVKLAISSQGKEPFTLAGAGREALHYSLKIEIGGIAGVVAPLVGKQPPDSHVWILGGESPTFVKSEIPSYMGGPIWRTELLAPVWPETSDSKNRSEEKH